MIMLVNVGSVRTLLQTTGVVHIKSVVSFESMGAIVVPGTRAPRWATLFVCSLCFAMPCAAGPFAADGNDPPENVVIVTTGTVPASDADVPLEWLSNLAASDADVFPVDAQATARAPVRLAWVIATVIPRSLNDPVGL